MKIRESLEQRIRDLQRECERYVHERAVEVSKGASGVPAVVTERMIMAAAGGNVFQAALDVALTRQKDSEIAQREWKKEHAARLAAGTD